MVVQLYSVPLLGHDISFSRPVAAQLPLGSTMIGGQVARYVAKVTYSIFSPNCRLHRVIESKNKDFVVGDYVIGQGGWTDHSVGTAKTCFKLDASILENKRSAALGVLGMPGYVVSRGILTKQSL